MGCSIRPAALQMAAPRGDRSPGLRHRRLGWSPVGDIRGTGGPWLLRLGVASGGQLGSGARRTLVRPWAVSTSRRGCPRDGLPLTLSQLGVRRDTVDHDPEKLLGFSALGTATRSMQRSRDFNPTNTNQDHIEVVADVHTGRREGDRGTIGDGVIAEARERDRVERWLTDLHVVGGRPSLFRIAASMTSLIVWAKQAGRSSSLMCSMPCSAASTDAAYETVAVTPSSSGNASFGESADGLSRVQHSRPTSRSRIPPPPSRVVRFCLQQGTPPSQDRSRRV